MSSAYVTALSDEAIANFLTNDTPMENYTVNEVWDRVSGLKGFLSGENHTPYAENRVRMGVLRVSHDFQKNMRQTTRVFKSGQRPVYFWHETMKRLLKDSHRIGWLAGIGGLPKYDRVQQNAFCNAVSTRFIWFNKFVDRINQNGVDALSIHNAGMFGRGMTSLYMMTAFPASINPDVKQNTVDAFTRTMWTATKALYNTRAAFDFESIMLDLIDVQYRKAWNEGMRSAGLLPKDDMTPDMEAILQDAILSEINFVPGFAQEVIAASVKNSGYDQFRNRVGMWANRYNQIVELATRTVTDAGQKLKWEMGPTEEHCPSCSMLNGLVALKSEWDQAGLHPQNGPNPYLSCKGWKCLCELTPTDQRRSPHVLTTLFDAASVRYI